MSASAQTAKAAEIADGHAGTVLPTGLAALRQPFPASQIGKLPKGGIELDYVGHGAVTHRLLDVDPEWSWEPMALDPQGLPLFTIDNQGNPIAFWIRLTVCGTSRLGCGTCRAGQFDAEKVLIGDAIRNAAMRFGVALDLWTRGHAEDDEQRTEADDRSGPARKKEPRSVAPKSFAKAALLKLCEGDKELAKQAWAGFNGDAVQWNKDPADEVELRFTEWQNQPKEGERVPE